MPRQELLTNGVAWWISFRQVNDAVAGMLSEPCDRHPPLIVRFPPFTQYVLRRRRARRHSDGLIGSAAAVEPSEVEDAIRQGVAAKPVVHTEDHRRAGSTGR